MDLALFWRVVWRFRWIVGAGLLVAVVLAVLSTAKITFEGGTPKLIYRKPELWQSQTSLLITQQGFPWGRTYSAAAPSANNSAAASGGVTYIDAGGFANLSGLYARLASSDAVRSRIQLAPGEGVSAIPVVDSTNHSLPIVGIAGLAPTPSQAIDVSNKAAVAFKKYIDEQQRSAAIPASQRVVLQTINKVAQVQLVAGRKKTLPIVTFAAVLLATLILAFVLENARPRLRVSTAGVEPQSLQRTA